MYGWYGNSLNRQRPEEMLHHIRNSCKHLLSIAWAELWTGGTPAESHKTPLGGALGRSPLVRLEWMGCGSHPGLIPDHQTD